VPQNFIFGSEVPTAVGDYAASSAIPINTTDFKTPSGIRIFVRPDGIEHHPKCFAKCPCLNLPNPVSLFEHFVFSANVEVDECEFNISSLYPACGKCFIRQ
jgi:hypothetical protein